MQLLPHLYSGAPKRSLQVELSQSLIKACFTIFVGALYVHDEKYFLKIKF